MNISHISLSEKSDDYHEYPVSKNGTLLRSIDVPAQAVRLITHAALLYRKCLLTRVRYMKQAGY
jgi:hypothetical protein